MSNQSVVRTPALKPSLILLWLGMGLAFQIVYFGLPHPLRIAMIAMLGFAVMFFFNGRR